MICCLMGIPASGKTSIVRKIIAENPNWQTKKFLKLRFMINQPRKLIIFGMYPEEGTFAGTDMLSMAVLPDGIKFIEKWFKKYKDYSILIEGDRFNSSKFYNFLIDGGYHHKIFILKASEETMRQRHISRNNSQSERFLKTIATKIKNVESNFKTQELVNDTPEQQMDNIAIIKDALGIKTETKVR